MNNIVNSESKIQGIQLIRAICCLGILFAHSCYYAEVYFPDLNEGDLMYPGRVGMLI